MSIINKALFLLLIILFINHLTDGEILATFKRIFKSFSCGYNKAISIPKETKSQNKDSSDNKPIDSNEKTNKELKDKMTESFNNMFVNREQFDDLFIKPNNDTNEVNQENDSDYNLIPSVIDV